MSPAPRSSRSPLIAVLLASVLVLGGLISSCTVNTTEPAHEADHELAQASSEEPASGVRTRHLLASEGHAPDAPTVGEERRAKAHDEGPPSDGSLPDGPLPLRVPDEATVPADSEGDLIRRGKLLATRTFEELPEHVGNGFHCTTCHLGAGTTPNAAPWVGITARFPQYRARSGREVSLEDRINACFSRSMNGKPLDATGPDMAALVAYMEWLSRGYPQGATVEGQGIPKLRLKRAPNPENGKALYQARCAACHGQDGGGLTAPGGAYAFPALWGDRSYNIGAGMARLYTAAGFVKHNMPLGAGGTLSDDEAWDIAAYFAYQPRPDLPGKENDWPKGGKPADARY